MSAKVSVQVDVSPDGSESTYAFTADNPLVVDVAAGFPAPILFDNTSDVAVTLMATGGAFVSGTSIGLQPASQEGHQAQAQTEALGPLEVSVEGCTGTPLTIIPRYTLTPSYNTPTPSITVAVGAQVLIQSDQGVNSFSTVETASGSAAALFVGEPSDDIVSFAGSQGTFTVAAEAADPTNDVSYTLKAAVPPLPGGEVPMSGTIVVTTTKKGKPNEV